MSKLQARNKKPWFTLDTGITCKITQSVNEFCLGNDNHTILVNLFVLQLAEFEKKRETLHKNNDLLQDFGECYKEEFLYTIDVPEAIYLC